MAFIDLGKLKFNWQGTWNSGTAYETDDVVFHGSQTFVATADVAAGQAEPQANTSWSLMAAGFNYRGTYAGGTTYYLHDVVTYGSALYMLEGIAETGSQTGVDPGSNPGSDNWEQLTPAPAANVMHAVGDMVIRNNANENARLPITEAVGVGITAQESPKETYPSRAFTYTLNGTNGNVINTTGSIPAVTYHIDVKAQRSTNYVIDGSDRDGDINWEYDGTIRVNIGDEIELDTSAIHPSHPLAIRDSAGGSSVTTGTYSGEGTALVTWNTTGVAAGTYYYQCTAHPGMVGQIIVESTENRQGSAGANGTMEVCRGKTYTITLDGVTSGVSYSLFHTAGAQTGLGDELLAGEGLNPTGGTLYSGSPVTFTFTPNETTPDTVYITSNANSADNVTITVNDLAYVPSWGTAAPDDSLVLDDQSGNFTTTLTTGTQSANKIITLPTGSPSTGQFLQATNTAGVTTWASVPPSSTGNHGDVSNVLLNGLGLHTFSSIPLDAVKIIITWGEVFWNTSGYISLRVGTPTGGILTSGYDNSTVYYGASASGANYTTHIVTNYGWSGGSSYRFEGKIELDRMSSNNWFYHVCSRTDNAANYVFDCTGYVYVGAGQTIDRVMMFPDGGGTFTGGFATLNYFTES